MDSSRAMGGSGIQADPLDRVLKALNHPIRRQILRILGEQRASASTIAATLNEEVGMVSYHLNQVLARDCEVVEMVDAIPRRGALEKVYELKVEIWEELAGGPERPVAACEWYPLQVDSKGLEEIGKARSDFHDRVRAAVGRSRNRHEGGQLVDAHQVLLGITAVAPAAP
jgi:DNA-binding transcriptional ArsR family regulator